MKFNPNQRYTRWSIRRLSVGVASVVVASGFFVLVASACSEGRAVSTASLRSSAGKSLFSLTEVASGTT